MIINQEAKSLLLPDGVKTEVSYLGRREVHTIPKAWEGGMTESQGAIGRWLVAQMHAEHTGHYRANVLLCLLDSFYFRQVRDWSSLSNGFLILHLQI